MSAPLLISALDPGRILADKETRALCKSDGGIRVYQKIGLEPGRFPTVIPDTKETYDGTMHGMIYGKYRYEESHTTNNSHGYFIYRHRTSIVAVADGKVVGDMVYYLRQGEPGLPGIVCPESISNEKLINAVFSLENEVTDPFPACPSGTPEVLRFKPDRLATLHKAGVMIDRGRKYNNDDWKRGINCDEKTKIDHWYEPSGPGEISLTGTQLQFFGANGNRCRSLAMPDSQYIICDDNGVSVLGFKRKAGNATLMLQKFSKTGQMVSEMEMSNVTPIPGAIVSYRESENIIKINVLTFGAETELGKCYSVSAPKSDLASHSTPTRIGPQDTVFRKSECDTD